MSKWRHCGRPVLLHRLSKEHSRQVLASRGLRQQNRVYEELGSSSRDAGLVPAFLDQATGLTHLSTFDDGKPAPIHVLDGLPEPLVVRRSRDGKATAGHGIRVAGFLKDREFFTRAQVTEEVRDVEFETVSKTANECLTAARGRAKLAQPKCCAEPKPGWL